MNFRPQKPLNNDFKPLSTRRLLYLIVFLAAVLRILGLSDESLWLDEAYTASRMQYTPIELAREFSGESESVCYYAVERVWCAVFGVSEFALRFPSVIYGTASVLGIFLFARELFSQSAGLLSALLFALNAFSIFYSQDARPYSLLLCSSVFSFYYLLRVLKTPSRREKIGYVVSTTILLWSHPLAPLLLGVHLLSLYLFKHCEGYEQATANPKAVLKLIMLTTLLYLPQFAFSFRTMMAKIAGKTGASWIEKPDFSALGKTVGQYFMNVEMAATVILIILVSLFVFRTRVKLVQSKIYLLIAGIGAAMLTPFAISYLLTPIYVARYTAPALPLLIILLSWSILEMKPAARGIALIVLLGLTVPVLYNYYSKADKDPWRETAAFLQEQYQAGDRVISHPVYTRDALGYYFKPLDSSQIIAAKTAVDIPNSADSSRVWLVESYVLKKPERLAGIKNRLSDHHQASLSTEIKPYAPENPDAYWLPRIRVTRYDPPGN